MLPLAAVPHGAIARWTFAVESPRLVEVEWLLVWFVEKLYGVCLKHKRNVLVLYFLSCHMWPARSTVMEICWWNMKSLWQRVLPLKFCTLDNFEQLMTDLFRDAELKTRRDVIPGIASVDKWLSLHDVSYTGEMLWCHFLKGFSEITIHKT